VQEVEVAAGVGLGHVIGEQPLVAAAGWDLARHPVRTPGGQLVFRDLELLAWLENLLHPRVAATYLEWRDRLAELPDAPRITVTEVPLLYEAGGETRFDVVVALTASPRIRERRGRPVSEDRSGRQLPDEEKLRRADFTYVNNGSLEDLDAFVARVMSQLQQDDMKKT
jgi:dephospho-CoA kinase